MKIKLFVFLFFFTLFSAQETVVYQAPSEKRFENMNQVEDLLSDKQYNTENRLFPKTTGKNFQEKYKGSDFDYTTVKPKLSIWDRLMNRISKILSSIFGDLDSQEASDFVNIFLRILAVIIIGLVLYFLIRFLLDKNGNFIFGKKNRKVVLHSEDLHENIHEIRFDEVIREYELKKDFRTATRYQFLNILKKLTDRNIIKWEPEKTNKDYLTEVKQPDLKKNFRDLAYIYENVWYGEFDIDEESYQKFKQRFSKFLS